MDPSTPAPTRAPGTPHALPDPLRLHLPELGLPDAAAYLAWCTTHGLAARLDKPLHVMRREVDVVRRARAMAALARARARQRPLRALARIARGELEPAVFHGTDFKQAGHAVAATPRKDGTRAAFARTLDVLGAKADSLLASWGPDRRRRPFIHVVLRAHRLRRAWLRPVETWRRRHRDPHDACHDLVRHLFVRYEPPAVLWHAWYRRDPAGATFRNWFVRAGRGESLRGLEGPIRLTRRIAHLLPEAPRWLAVERGLRWAQLRAAGAAPWAALAIARSWVLGPSEGDPFWIEVARWLTANAPDDPEELQGVLRWLRRQRFDPRDVVQPDGSVRTEPPPKPRLTMRGRTWASIVRDWTAWQASQRTGDAPHRWEPSGLRGFEWTRGSDRKTRIRWTLREILTLADLAQEGRTMHHCVLTYADRCSQGHTSIWSLSHSVGPRARRVQTLEVDPLTKEIDECLGRFNREPEESVRRVVRRWARQEGLVLPKGF